MRCLAFIKAKFEFSVTAADIEGSRNSLADALSRDKLDVFLSHATQACPAPTNFSQELLDLTVIAKPDWTSHHWTELWTAIFAEA